MDIIIERCLKKLQDYKESSEYKTGVAIGLELYNTSLPQGERDLYLDVLSLLKDTGNCSDTKSGLSWFYETYLNLTKYVYSISLKSRKPRSRPDLLEYIMKKNRLNLVEAVTLVDSPDQSPILFDKLNKEEADKVFNDIKDWGTFIIAKSSNSIDFVLS